MAEKELEKLTDAMFLAHEMITVAKHGESLVNTLKIYISSAIKPNGPQPDISSVFEFEQTVRNKILNEEKYSEVIPTLKKYSQYKGIKAMIDELKKEFPNAKY